MNSLIVKYNIHSPQKAISNIKRLCIITDKIHIYT